MTVTIIISFCLLLLVAYVFDLTTAKTKIPSVILLLLLGYVLRQFTLASDISLPDFSPVLPVLGTIGLILIVLEGSLELDLTVSKPGLIRKSLLGALLPMIALAVGLALGFHYFGHYGLKDSLMNAVPLCVISSAIAIPSVRNLSSRDKEFVIYESSLSDILGVLLFNFLALNETIDASSFGQFALQLGIIAIVSLVATIGLSLLLNKIEHHIKFIPIILLVILLYSVLKIYHLPGLLFILLFGLFIGNLDALKRYKWIDKFRPDELKNEVRRFKEMTIEVAFLVRALFFLLFGFLIETPELLNPHTLPWAVGISALIYTFRALQLRFSRLPIQPLVYVAPRGLITILLFLSIDPGHTIALVNKSLIIQLIIISALIMMLGLMTNRDNQRA